MRTIVRGDGTWSLDVPLTLSFADGFGPSGRYSAAEWSDDSLSGGVLFGGASTLIQEASEDTVVALAKPTLTLNRQGRRLAVAIRVKGGDSFVRYRLLWGGREVSLGRLTSAGRATDVIPSPSGSGSFDLTVSAPRTQSASVSVPFASVS